jgi:hypothetical protein
MHATIHTIPNHTTAPVNHPITDNLIANCSFDRTQNNGINAPAIINAAHRIFAVVAFHIFEPTGLDLSDLADAGATIKPLKPSAA